MSEREIILLEVHKRLASILGQLAWCLNRRGFNRAEKTAWLGELRELIDIIEKL